MLLNFADMLRGEGVMKISSTSQLISHLVSLRMTLVEELLGADYAVHNILHSGIGLEDAADVLRKYHEDIEVGLDPTGNNLGEYLQNCRPPKNKKSLVVS